jgi:hypothetical protein
MLVALVNYENMNVNNFYYVLINENIKKNLTKAKNQALKVLKEYLGHSNFFKVNIRLMENPKVGEIFNRNDSVLLQIKDPKKPLNKNDYENMLNPKNYSKRQSEENIDIYYVRADDSITVEIIWGMNVYYKQIENISYVKRLKRMNYQELRKEINENNFEGLKNVAIKV